jgi:flavin-dependent thymidylate synthase
MKTSPIRVSLINHTQGAYDLLVGTKSTRLRGKTAAEMTDAEKDEHFAYMLDTIKSSFEFVDYIFQIEGVSKNFTHQLVRTRTGSYQQEASRAIDLSTNGVVTPENLTEEQRVVFYDGVADAGARYRELLESGVARQDARAILPSNMMTKIMVKFNLRTMMDTSKLRLCARAQDEYQNVFRLMRAAVVDVHPWAEQVMQVHCVAMGTCAFPRWGAGMMTEDNVLTEDKAKFHHFQCAHYDARMDLTEVKREAKIKFWAASEIAQSNPVAKNGVSM